MLPSVDHRDKNILQETDSLARQCCTRQIANTRTCFSRLTAETYTCFSWFTEETRRCFRRQSVETRKCCRRQIVYKLKETNSRKKEKMLQET